MIEIIGNRNALNNEINQHRILLYGETYEKINGIIYNKTFYEKQI